MEIPTKKMTYREFREWEFDDDDTSRYELINGKLVQKPSLSIEHQNIVGNLLMALKIYAREKELGKVFHAPLDVVLDDDNAFQPDVFFVRRNRYHILENSEEVVMGAPDLVVEILSKGTATYDRGIKKDIYEEYGVREYWLIEPKSKTIEIYSFGEQRFKLVQYAEETGVVKSMVLEGFEIELAKVFEE